MNIIPPTGYGRPVIPSRTNTRRLNASDNHTHPNLHSDRRRHGERRQNASIASPSPLEMRQVGDRRHSNRLFVTT